MCAQERCFSRRLSCAALVHRKARVTPCSVVDIKTESSLEGETDRSVLIYAQISGLKKSIFVLSLVLPGGLPQALVPVGAQSDLGLVYFIFHCNNHVTSFFIRHWELRFDVAPELGLLRELSCGVRSFDGESGSLAMRSVQYRRVLPQWRCSIERIPPERTEGYCHSGSAVSREYRRDVWRDQFLRRAQGGCAAAASVLVPWRAHLEQMLQKIRASRTPRASSRGFHTNIKIYYELLKNKNKKSAGGAWPNFWGEASSR